MSDSGKLQMMVETALQDRLQQWKHKKPESLYAPVCYAMGAGGKRLRPLLVLLGYQLFGDHPGEALPAALAVEVFHNFTLLHDDIMDKAEIRRNQPAVHRRFSENHAILSGDVMAFIAYQLLMETRNDRFGDIAGLFTQTAVEICEGQQFDMDFEIRTDVTVEEYLEMIRLKTAVLLACALKTGSLLGGADEAGANQMYDAGINLGFAFQLQDDYLDTYGDESAFGKKIGGDIISGKKTFLLTAALRRAGEEDRQELLRWLEDKNAPADEKVNAVKSVFNRLKIGELAQHQINTYHMKATGLIEMLGVDPFRKQPLIRQCEMLIKRQN